MKYIELQYAFELEAANLDKELTVKLSSQDILYWLNQGVNKFIKTRYNGNNTNKTAFEQDEKRSRDLLSLLTTEALVSDDTKVTDQYTYTHYTYPDNLMFTVDESVVITITSTQSSKATEIFECTHDSYMYRITNTLTDFHLRNNYARPLRVVDATGCNLYAETDKYEISSYTITFLKKPLVITLENPFDEYDEFPEYAHSEIVKLAVGMYLENVKDQRYATINNEINMME